MSVLSIDRNEACNKIYQEPFVLQHDLADHPLFTLPRLIELAQSMSGDQVEYSSGMVGINQDPDTIPSLDMSVSDVISYIEEQNAWLVMKRVETDPAYKALLQSFLIKLGALTGRPVSEFFDLQGFIFISSAHATTPFHVDAEENILLQIKGDKYVHIFDNRQRKIISEEELEISPSKHRNQYYESAYEKHAKRYVLKAGDGVHIPYLEPHWVRTGHEYCISIAMTWKTPQVKRFNKIRLMNGTLRHFGLPQKPPGHAPMRDSLKVTLHDVSRLIINPLRKSETMRRLLRSMIYGSKANYYYAGNEKQKPSNGE